MRVTGAEIAAVVTTMTKNLEERHHTPRSLFAGVENMVVPASDQQPALENVRAEHVTGRTGVTVTWQQSDRRFVTLAGGESLVVVEILPSGEKMTYGINGKVGQDTLGRLAIDYPDVQLGEGTEEKEDVVVSALRRIAGQL